MVKISKVFEKEKKDKSAILRCRFLDVSSVDHQPVEQSLNNQFGNFFSSHQNFVHTIVHCGAGGIVVADSGCIGTKSVLLKSKIRSF
ncbi:Hypothetical predicted protein [Octopus vulgaris]|uniref:Uncharacterized protein n=1 Tax=Octopus vulgaris TaxID=6645 RepID=A0AA36BI10_OCTVU|nr:Hypothetical predicted protein [Octopus vulgaris]